MFDARQTLFQSIQLVVHGLGYVSSKHKRPFLLGLRVRAAQEVPAVPFAVYMYRTVAVVLRRASFKKGTRRGGSLGVNRAQVRVVARGRGGVQGRRYDRGRDGEERVRMVRVVRGLC